MSQTMLAIANLGPTEFILIVLVIFLLFGATRLPQLAKALGQSKKMTSTIKIISVGPRFAIASID